MNRYINFIYVSLRSENKSCTDIHLNLTLKAWLYTWYLNEFMCIVIIYRNKYFWPISKTKFSFNNLYEILMNIYIYIYIHIFFWNCAVNLAIDILNTLYAYTYIQFIITIIAVNYVSPYKSANREKSYWTDIQYYSIIRPFKVALCAAHNVNKPRLLFKDVSKTKIVSKFVTYDYL